MSSREISCHELLRREGFGDDVIFHSSVTKLEERFASRIALGDREECWSVAERRDGHSDVVGRRIPLKQIWIFFRELFDGVRAQEYVTIIYDFTRVVADRKYWVEASSATSLLLTMTSSRIPSPQIRLLPVVRPTSVLRSQLFSFKYFDIEMILSHTDWSVLKSSDYMIQLAVVSKMMTSSSFKYCLIQIDLMSSRDIVDKRLNIVKGHRWQRSVETWLLISLCSHCTFDISGTRSRGLRCYFFSVFRNFLGSDVTQTTIFRHVLSDFNVVIKIFVVLETY